MRCPQCGSFRVDRGPRPGARLPAYVIVFSALVFLVFMLVIGSTPARGLTALAIAAAVSAAVAGMAWVPQHDRRHVSAPRSLQCRRCGYEWSAASSPVARTAADVLLLLLSILLLPFRGLAAAAGSERPERRVPSDEGWEQRNRKWKEQDQADQEKRRRAAAAEDKRRQDVGTYLADQERQRQEAARKQQQQRRRGLF